METEPAPGAYDPESVKARYLAERDRRLVPGRTDIVDLRADERYARYTRDPFTPYTDRASLDEELDVVIVGGGIAGLLAGVELRKAGIERLRIVDQAGGVGGTWYWNRYPGIMCDVESTIYLPLLEELGYVPKDRYASGQEILEHLQRIADRYELVGDGLFHTGVERAEWDDRTARWHVHTDRGDHLRPRFYVLAVGILNLLKIPDVAGLDDFAGHSFHAARWDYAYTGGAPGEEMTELGDRVVGLVGTGATISCWALRSPARASSSARPSVGGIARASQALEPVGNAGGQLQAMLRLPGPGRDLIDDGWTHHYAAAQHPPRRPDAGSGTCEGRRSTSLRMGRTRLQSLVHEPTAAQAWPRYLCKRPCFHDEFLSAFNEPNVTLVDCPGGFDRIAPEGPVVEGTTYPVDLLVLGTGFEPELTPLHRRAGHEIVGRGGVTLAEKWADGAGTLFGMMTRGFPNLFVMPAPGQQAVVTVNYTQLAVLGAEVVGGAVAALEKRGVRAFEVTEAAETAWTEEVVRTHVDASSIRSRVHAVAHQQRGPPRASTGAAAGAGASRLLQVPTSSRRGSARDLEDSTSGQATPPGSRREHQAPASRS
ncbi:MAG: NAD(P)/FAD-dependent oxidoreductase [Microthrixaceae bacterium]|nr:NAD(P)/FAD-dependent oxidoreductase [Microthrixaceae bacterium]